MDDLRLYTAVMFNGRIELTAITARGALILKGLKSRYPNADADELARRAKAHDVDVEIHDTPTINFENHVGAFEMTMEQVMSD